MLVSEVAAISLEISAAQARFLEHLSDASAEQEIVEVFAPNLPVLRALHGRRLIKYGFIGMRWYRCRLTRGGIAQLAAWRAS